MIISIKGKSLCAPNILDVKHYEIFAQVIHPLCLYFCHINGALSMLLLVYTGSFFWHGGTRPTTFHGPLLYGQNNKEAVPSNSIEIECSSVHKSSGCTQSI